MQGLKISIALSTLFLIIYTIAAQFSVTEFIVPYMFIMSPFVVVALVIKVLKFGTPSKYTFSERFYDDVDISPVQTEKTNTTTEQQVLF